MLRPLTTRAIGATGGRPRASSVRSSPNFNVVQDRYPLVPEQLQKVYDDTQVGLRREKAEAAASQVTYYNAEKWLYEKLAGAETAPPDLKTMMVADLLLEQQGLPYYIDWDAATRGRRATTWRRSRSCRGGRRVCSRRRGVPAICAWTRSISRPGGGAWAGECSARRANRRTRALAAVGVGLYPDQPADANVLRCGHSVGLFECRQDGHDGGQRRHRSWMRCALRVLPELMETWEAGGRGSITVSQYEMLDFLPQSVAGGCGFGPGGAAGSCR